MADASLPFRLDVHERPEMSANIEQICKEMNARFPTVEVYVDAPYAKYIEYGVKPVTDSPRNVKRPASTAKPTSVAGSMSDRYIGINWKNKAWDQVPTPIRKIAEWLEVKGLTAYATKELGRSYDAKYKDVFPNMRAGKRDKGNYALGTKKPLPQSVAELGKRTDVRSKMLMHLRDNPEDSLQYGLTERELYDRAKAIYFHIRLKGVKADPFFREGCNKAMVQLKDGKAPGVEDLEDPKYPDVIMMGIGEHFVNTIKKGIATREAKGDNNTPLYATGKLYHSVKYRVNADEVEDR